MGKYYKHPQYKHVYGNSIKTPVGRVAWPSLVTPKDPPPPKPGEQPGQARFEITILLPKDAPETQTFWAELKKMTDEMLVVFNEGRPAPLAGLRLLPDGDEFDMEKYPYYKGCHVLTARNSKETKLYGRKKEQVGRESIVGGMKGILIVTPLITAHGVSFKLEATQLVEDDGTRFGGGVRDFTQFLDALDPETPVAAEAASAETPAPATPAPAAKAGKKAAIDLL